MTFFNPFGLVFMILIMVPNIIYAVKCKKNGVNDFANLPQTKFWKIQQVFEQIGRYGCFACMIFNIPGTYFGFASDNSFAIYLIVDFILVVAYCVIWIFCFKKNNLVNNLFNAISLSVLPSLVFLFSGILSHSLLLIFFAWVFAPCHIAISVRSCIIKK